MKTLHNVLPTVIAIVGAFLSYVAAFVWPEYVTSFEPPTRMNGVDLVMFFLFGMYITFFAVFFAWVLTSEDYQNARVH